MAPLHRTKKLGFLSLPPEARHRIYELLLITSKPPVIPHCRPATQPPVAPCILRTSRQIHHEASPILYRDNTFLIAEPHRILPWLHRIGGANLAQLRRIRIFVHAVYAPRDVPFLAIKRDGPAWYDLLDCLASRATGLRHVFVCWDAAEDCTHMGARARMCASCEGWLRIQGVGESGGIGGVSNAMMGEGPGISTEKMMGAVVVRQEGDRTASSLQRVRQFQRGAEGLVP